MTIAIFIISICAAMAIGMPIAFALLFCGVCLMLQQGGLNAQLLTQQLIGGADNFPLMAVLFFLVTGHVMNAAGISRRIVAFSLALVGHIRGGLGYVAIIATFIFAGLSGSAVADAAALCAIMVPMMAERGYDKGSSAALIGASSIIALIIPPSLSFIIFASISGVSVIKLFMAGLFPAVLLALGLAATWFLLNKKNPASRYPRASLQELLTATKDAFGALLLPVIIVLGIRKGFTTPTEAAVVAVFYTAFLNFAVYRELDFRQFFRAVVEGVKASSVIMFLIAAAMVSAWMIAIANIPDSIAALLMPLLGHPLLLMLAINLVVLLVGTAMDSTPTVLILTPVLMPIIKASGIDPVYFGVIFVLNNAIGLLTPPVGTVLNAACGGSGVTMDEMLVKVWPFLIVEILVLLLLTCFPSLIIAPYQFLTK